MLVSPAATQTYWMTPPEFLNVWNTYMLHKKGDATQPDTIYQ